ncbi:hypothetical protein GGTG_10042 [Gaeumannomyces tritici R3-111a-1]|uniref:Uncharacterized protein n=1 Tax=Gaeumannomyces tritici (strain R3-111a-1) TaxID=644352 RepID=J3P958_GAET3|nr:hypothetical protein GGTG_10042 [Gaeumannomyces tritici R3-111a-1]EJT73193.1 hypothetical protein GGTG_10042 [Gaeumannomyces tritici R3-111a-1]
MGGYEAQFRGFVAQQPCEALQSGHNGQVWRMLWDKRREASISSMRNPTPPIRQLRPTIFFHAWNIDGGPFPTVNIGCNLDAK